MVVPESLPFFLGEKGERRLPLPDAHSQSYRLDKEVVFPSNAATSYVREVPTFR